MPIPPFDDSTEIEITPEMIEAGVGEFLGYDSRFEEPRDAVIQIYLAMQRARVVVSTHGAVPRIAGDCPCE